MTSTTGTSLQGYFSWIERELEAKDYGEVSVTFVVTRGQVTDVKRVSLDSEHFALEAKR